MVELLALAFTQLSAKLWARAVLGKALTVVLWLVYGVSLPQALHWSEDNLPETVNLALPLLGLLAATGSAVRHWHHHHHAHHHTATEPAEGPAAEPVA